MADFTCSRPGHAEDQFERDVTEWLTSPGRGGALEAVRLGEAEVQLYFHDDGRLIGFGAIGGMIWEMGGQPLQICLLHYFGVHSNFRQQPSVDRLARYGRRILGGLVEEVRRRDFVFFALYVDPVNPVRSGFYPEFGFREIDEIDDGDRRWVRMLRHMI